jgi:DNA primase
MPSSDWENYKEEVRARSDLLAVVGAHLRLRKVGRRFVGLCPFHTDSKPSFYVDPEKGIFHCFGCGAGGDLFNFVMRIENVDFPTALSILARRAGVPEPEGKRDPAQAKRTRSLKERALLALEQAQTSFAEKLAKAPRDHPAVEFLAERAVPQKNWQKFGLGLAPAGWEETKDYLTNLGFSEEELSFAGLITSGERGWHDFFHNRLTFAICEPLGKIVGFGGRSLDGSEPKYLNSGETPVFQKGRLLYPLHIARQGLKEGFPAILVEGYLDAISLLQEGIPGVVAPLGTALTEGQASTLARFAEQVIIYYDGDSAGRKATLRSLPILLATGLEVRVALLPEGKDPDDYIRAQGITETLKLLGESIDGWEYLIDSAGGLSAAASPEGRAQLVQTLSQALYRLPSGTRRLAIVESISQRLNLDPTLLRKAIDEAAKSARRYGEGPSEPAGREEFSPQESASPPRYERELLALLLNHPNYLPRAQEELSLTGLVHPSSVTAIQTLLSLHGEDSAELLKQLLAIIGEDPATSELVVACVHTQHNWDTETAYQDLVRRVNQEALHRKMEESFAEHSSLDADSSTVEKVAEFARHKARICEEEKKRAKGK